MQLKNNNDIVLIKNISSSVIYKGVGLVISFFSTPLYMKLIEDQEILGVWFTILSMLQWITILDLGIGNGLRNNIVGCLQSGNKKELKEYISSGYIILGVVVTIMLVLVTLVSLFLDWNSILNISTFKIGTVQLKFVIIITIISTLLLLELKIVLSILYAMQKNALANLTSLLTNLIILVFLFVSCRNNSNDLFDFQFLAVVYAVASIIPVIAITIVLFSTDLKGAAPSFKYFDKAKAKTVIGSSVSFFIIQIGLIVIVSTNSWLITKLCGAKYSVDFQIYSRLYSLAPMIFTLITQPMWSGFSAAKERGDWKWILSKYKKVVGFAGLCVIGLMVLMLVFPVIVDIWLREEAIEIDMIISIIFLFSTAAQISMYCFTCFANGMNNLKCQVICIVFAALAKIPLTYFLVDVYPSWSMIVLSEGLVLLPIAVAQPIFNHIDLKRLKKDNEIIRR